jgi:TDG/mug DNA glycosylase family protein
MTAPRPTKRELEEAIFKTVPDLIAPGLKVLFCGINPGLYSGATGLHFARPGNRFWKALHLAGFTDRLLDPEEEPALLEAGYGITCFVSRTTARADELSKDEFVNGGEILMRKLALYKPRMLAVLGIGAYKAAFDIKKASVGLQSQRLGDTPVWLLPNPSGLNANYQLPDLVKLFAELRKAVDELPG